MSTIHSRRKFNRLAVSALAAPWLCSACTSETGPRRLGETPNIILAMSDDQGWGDTAYNEGAFGHAGLTS